VAIIHKGRLVAQVRWKKLRTGISGEAGNRTTLEQIFLQSLARADTERPQLEALSMADVTHSVSVFEQIRLVADFAGEFCGTACARRIIAST